MATKNHNTTSKGTRIKQRENLKILVENSSVSRVRSAGRIFKYGAASFTRNIWLSIAATLVMTVTLVILLITVGASLILNSTAEAMRQKIDITIYFRPGTPYETLSEMSTIIKTDPNVKDVTISDSAMQYQTYLEENSDNTDLIEVLQDPAMSEIMLNTTLAVMTIKVYDTDNIEQLKTIVNTTEIFQTNIDPDTEPTYDENRAIIETINSWANIAKNGGLILGAVFLAISILMIFNTIRMAIFSRREEIYMMRLVGADSSFIRGPFRIEAEICGIISGTLAVTLAYGAYRLLAPSLMSYNIDINAIAEYMSSSKLVFIYLATIALGMVIGTISARLAMHKYLK